MSATSAAVWQWSPEVITFARAQGIDAYLEPLRQATCRLFPTARTLRIIKEDDPEIRDLSSITYEVCVPYQDVPDFVETHRRWVDELYKICPAPRVCDFVLSLLLDE